MATKRDREKREKVSAKDRATTHKSGYDSTSIDRPEGVKLLRLESEKARRIDVIPFKVGKGNPHAEEGKVYFERTYWVHPRIGADENSYVCLAKTCGEKCPVCEHRAKLTKDPDSDEDEIKALAPKERQLWNVIDADNRAAGIQLFDISFHLFGKLLDKAVRDADEDEDFEFFADPEEGYTLKLSVSEKTMGKSRPFYEVSQITFKNRSEQYEQDIIDEAHCLDDLIKIVPYDKLRAIFLQISGDEDEDEDDKPRKSTKGTKTRKPSKKDEDDEDDEPAPKKKRASTRDEDDDDEPAQKKKAPTSEFEEGEVAIHTTLGRVEIVRVNVKAGMASVINEDGDTEKVDLEDLKKPKPKTKKKPEPEEDEDDEPAPKKKTSKKSSKDEDDDDEEDEAPKKKSKKPSKDEDDEDDEPKPKKKPSKKDDEDDEEEEEPAPKKKSKKSKDEDDDDEDEPAPKKKKASKDDDDDDWGSW